MTSDVRLQATELSALIDLIRVVANIDGDITPEESDEIALIARQVGEGEFWERVQSSAFRAARDINVEECAVLVQRRGAQELILSLLEELAEADGVDQAERQTLAKLRRLWVVGR